MKFQRRPDLSTELRINITLQALLSAGVYCAAWECRLDRVAVGTGCGASKTGFPSGAWEPEKGAFVKGWYNCLWCKPLFW